MSLLFGKIAKIWSYIYEATLIFNWLILYLFLFLFDREAADDDVVNHGVLEDVIHILGQQWRRFEMKRNVSTFLGKHSKERKEIQTHICYLRITNVCVSACVCVCVCLSVCFDCM